MKSPTETNDPPYRRTCEQMNHTSPSTCMCGVGVYRRLPTAVTELRCKCIDPDFVSSLTVGVDAICTFCRNCGNLHFTSLSMNTYTCEGCGRYFTYDLRQFPVGTPRFKLPLPHTLCRRCDVPVTVHAERRKNFRIN